ncbi:hypothetical protein AAFF_G00294450 [Aldrovandia affinis]|uniref:Uncharacterized protein n=1 Tax=Aldrovandia affinis TaxID=143900 RepID=A0AAD7R9B2_9TELE|nr:hypothetical protein AAFF_G00294450 [Aldrovandia affinis]
MMLAFQCPASDNGKPLCAGSSDSSQSSGERVETGAGVMGREPREGGTHGPRLRHRDDRRPRPLPARVLPGLPTCWKERNALSSRFVSKKRGEGNNERPLAKRQAGEGAGRARDRRALCSGAYTRRLSPAGGTRGIEGKVEGAGGTLVHPGALREEEGL